MRIFATVLTFWMTTACSRDGATVTPPVQSEQRVPRAVAPPGGPAVTPPGPLVFPPRALKFMRGGDPSLVVELNGTEVRRREVGGFGPRQGQVLVDTTSTPDAQAWQRLHAEFGGAGAWDWAARYSSQASQQLHGVGWSLEMTASDGRVFHAQGYNAMPPGLQQVERALVSLCAQH